MPRIKILSMTKLTHRSCSAPQLSDTDKIIVGHAQVIEKWFADRCTHTKLPLYSSIDIRHDRNKITPIDCNLFPAGFNNLDSADLTTHPCIRTCLTKHGHPHAKRLLIIAENHTRNQHYAGNILHLKRFLTKNDLDVEVGILPSVANEKPSPSYETMTIRDGRYTLGPFDPDVILLNNDLSAGFPDLLCQETTQLILPDPRLGWSTRKKDTHCAHLEHIVEEFCHIVSLPVWTFSPAYAVVECIDCNDGRLYETAEDLFAKILARKKRENDPSPSYLVLKANAGTYGMGVLCIQHPSEIKLLNRKQRQKMRKVKDGLAVEQILLQEGVQTIDTVGTLAAEPVVYLSDQSVIGGFYRAHTKKGPAENLNAPGMCFAPLSLHIPTPVTPQSHIETQYAFVLSVAARLSVLAAAEEMKALT